MSDLFTFFDNATGLCHFYKWCLNNEIPHEIFNMILLFFKNSPKCIDCSIGCCKYNKYEYVDQIDTWVRCNQHKQNDISTQGLVCPLIEQLRKDSNNKSAVGKIILVSIINRKPIKIPLYVRVFFNNLLWRNLNFKIDNKIYLINVLDLSYELLFSLIGHFFSTSSSNVYEYPKKYYYIKLDIKPYLYRIKQSCLTQLYRDDIKFHTNFYDYGTYDYLTGLYCRMHDLCTDSDTLTI
jgi:hypothetical protein